MSTESFAPVIAALPRTRWYKRQALVPGSNRQIPSRQKAIHMGIRIDTTMGAPTPLRPSPDDQWSGPLEPLPEG
jgi:hypothetical protein